MLDTNESNHMHSMHVIHSVFSILNFLFSTGWLHVRHSELIAVRGVEVQSCRRIEGTHVLGSSTVFLKKSGIRIQILEPLNFGKHQCCWLTFRNKVRRHACSPMWFPLRPRNSTKCLSLLPSSPLSLNHEYCIIKVSLLNENIPRYLVRNEVPIPQCIWSGYSRWQSSKIHKPLTLQYQVSYNT